MCSTWRRGQRGLALAAITLTLSACSQAAHSGFGAGQRHTIAGETMGTTFAATVVSGARVGGVHASAAASPAREFEPATVEAEVRRLLDEIEGRMSHYRADSELSRFNGARTTAPRPMSSETLGVVAEALAVSRASGGAFDVTVGPLVEAWGFGPGGRAPAAPDEATLAALRGRVGAELLEVDLAAGTLRKRRGDVVVDLSAIAKGYAVDAVAALLDDLGFGDHLVEIGGELRAAGTNEAGTPWRVAIERPVPGAPAAQRILPLTDAALATSGDYRNFYELDGARVSHTVDPRTGRPVTHGLLSVSVIAERCSLADARSTALNVLGPEAGYALAVEQGWAALFVEDDGAGRLVERETPAFMAAVRWAGSRERQ
ncbi:MAG: FAD:protein FMN transferase [Acidobacteria bacterium]|nr:FAD:protein FMN transferase [Acidobacteriota bacterium]